MEKKVKVLQVNAGSKNFGGVSAFLYNVYKNIDRTKFQFDFLSPKKTTYGTIRSEIEEMGGKIFELNIRNSGFIFYIKLFFKTKEFLKNNNYDIIHINSGALLFNFTVALSAKISGIKRIIVHSHNVKIVNNKIKIFFRKILKTLISSLATDYLACSMLAAKSMFSQKLINKNKVIIIKNGIDVNKFRFNNDIRIQYRKDLKIEDKIVIGHVGRFVRQKNHEYLIDVFNEMVKINNNVELLLVGEGELEEEIKEKVNAYDLSKKVKFLGVRKDVANLMQAMDAFIFPSLYEGLGIVLIEAQSTGLFVMTTTEIPSEAKITKNMQYLSLKSSPKEWAETFFDKYNSKFNRNLSYKSVEENNYTISYTAKVLEEIYSKK
jgi:glycosyltransferase involved in cell wall biosynthesis